MGGRAPAEPLIVKVASAVSAFDRLGAVAELLARLAAAGIRTPAPTPAADGTSSVVLSHGHQQGSVVVRSSFVEGDHLDVDDLAAVHATGAEVGRLHGVLAETLPGSTTGYPAAAPARHCATDCSSGWTGCRLAARRARAAAARDARGFTPGHRPTRAADPR